MDHVETFKQCVQKFCGLSVDVSPYTPLLENIRSAARQLQESGHSLEEEALQQAVSKCCGRIEFGGLGYNDRETLTASENEEVMFQVEAYLQAIHSKKNAKALRQPLTKKSTKTQPMTLAQKIFAHHALDGCPNEGLSSGDVIRVGVDWIMASELSYRAISKTVKEVGDPGIFRNDRFWLAGDHVYDPRIADAPHVKALYRNAETAKKKYKMTEYQGMNYTIMHTEFVRQRAQPGMLIVGADSHTCSAGSMGCLAIGLGAIDVSMALITGETWFKIPESILVMFTGKPGFGITGKDVILHILKVLKRNTVAAERIVEFGGPGAEYLSIDARFAISNMCTEFGAVTGVFIPDTITQQYVSKRPTRANKSDAVYFRPDEKAPYVEKFEIDLSEVEPTIALYPNPDDVVPVSEKPDMKFDGVFIGACTTTEEELVLAGLILKAGIAKGLHIAPGNRHVVPGSLPIVEKLKKMGLLQVYEDAGFTRGPPGCSYCVGMAADQAGEGEVWLSSQNRNFRNRMGKGSIGNITSAAVVAASSFSMSLTNPTELIAQIDYKSFDDYKAKVRSSQSNEVPYVEPQVGERLETQATEPDTPGAGEGTREQPSQTQDVISSRVITLEDFIDTDALAPAQALSTANNDEEFGEHCLEFTHPEFRQQVRDGQKVVVAGKAFGVGSSREEAVRALKGLGVKAVIAKSYAFIYGRNQASLVLLGLTIEDEDFYEAAKPDTAINIDLSRRVVSLGDQKDGKEFSFVIPEMELRLIMNDGVGAAYSKFRDGLWQHMVPHVIHSHESKGDFDEKFVIDEGMVEGGDQSKLQW